MFVRQLCFCFFLSMTVFSTGCQSSSDSAQPAAVITQKMVLEGVPSASGIERAGDQYYVIGDDSPYLFCLNEQFKVVQKVSLLEAKSMVGGRIPKPVKPDLEAITSVMLEGQPYLFIVGSGATSMRNVGYLVPITRQGAGKPVQVPLEKLYDQLRQNKAITGDAALNIEGLSADEEYLYLLQRFAPGGHNVLITYTLSSITSFLRGRGEAPQPSAIQPWVLPDLAQIKTGFSGLATGLGGRLLFTASAEETPNAVLDGEVYGSLVGWLKAHPKGSAQATVPQTVVPVKEKDGSILKSKIESICIIDEHRHHLEAVAVADNDDGSSELVLLTFNW
ncbi:DUF6929 family protein [Rufibacter aurantiacus]|uniref:DUF6929 family protein n=1 Tax=Rufibacter aurantiacus TaxID=2817374 RepID=UPI001B302919|nr:hypothetical protein [Rufibacter aurantiacus]